MPCNKECCKAWSTAVHRQRGLPMDVPQAALPYGGAFAQALGSRPAPGLSSQPPPQPTAQPFRQPPQPWQPTQPTALTADEIKKLLDQLGEAVKANASLESRLAAVEESLEVVAEDAAKCRTTMHQVDARAEALAEEQMQKIAIADALVKQLEGHLFVEKYSVGGCRFLMMFGFHVGSLHLNYAIRWRKQG